MCWTILNGPVQERQLWSQSFRREAEFISCALRSWLPRCPEATCTGCDVHTHRRDRSLLLLRFCGLKSALWEVFDLLKQVHKRSAISRHAPLLWTRRPTTSQPCAHAAASVSAAARHFPGLPDQQHSRLSIQILLPQRNLLISEHVHSKWKNCFTYHCPVMAKDRLVNHVGKSSGVFRQGQGRLQTPWH